MDHVNNLERAILVLAILSQIIDPKNRLDRHDLVAAGNLLDVVASGTLSKLDRSYNVSVFNIPGFFPMNAFGDQLLAASGMTHIPCSMTRPWKRAQLVRCPLLLQF